MCRSPNESHYLNRSIAGLPGGGQVVQVGGAAVIATTSALLAETVRMLTYLKAVKPTVKKSHEEDCSKIRGSPIPVEVCQGNAEQSQAPSDESCSAGITVCVSETEEGTGVGMLRGIEWTCGCDNVLVDYLQSRLHRFYTWDFWDETEFP